MPERSLTRSRHRRWRFFAPQREQRHPFPGRRVPVYRAPLRDHQNRVVRHREGRSSDLARRRRGREVPVCGAKGTRLQDGASKGTGLRGADQSDATVVSARPPRGPRLQGGAREALVARATHRLRRKTHGPSPQTSTYRVGTRIRCPSEQSATVSSAQVSDAEAVARAGPQLRVGGDDRRFPASTASVGMAESGPTSVSLRRVGVRFGRGGLCLSPPSSSTSATPRRRLITFRRCLIRLGVLILLRRNEIRDQRWTFAG